MSVGETRSRDVQLLLWAVGEARERGARAQRDRAGERKDMAPADGSDYFTEWQPSTA